MLRKMDSSHRKEREGQGSYEEKMGEGGGREIVRRKNRRKKNTDEIM